MSHKKPASARRRVNLEKVLMIIDKHNCGYDCFSYEGTHMSCLYAISNEVEAAFAPKKKQPLPRKR